MIPILYSEIYVVDMPPIQKIENIEDIIKTIEDEFLGAMIQPETKCVVNAKLKSLCEDLYHNTGILLSLYVEIYPSTNLITIRKGNSND